MIRSPHPGAETESQSDSRSPRLLQQPARALGQRRDTTADLIVAASTGGPPHCTDRSSGISCFSARRALGPGQPQAAVLVNPRDVVAYSFWSGRRSELYKTRA